jgi:hypothetical protein
MQVKMTFFFISNQGAICNGWSCTKKSQQKHKPKLNKPKPKNLKTNLYKQHKHINLTNNSQRT